MFLLSAPLLREERVIGCFLLHIKADEKAFMNSQGALKCVVCS